MSKFNNYLGLPPLNGLEPTLHDYRHAARLFSDDGQARAPKYGFLYYVQFIINTNASANELDKNIGLFVKKIDLPKFTIKTETVNQYNRKTQVHTGLTYSPVSIEFHDDSSNITNNLWHSYYISHIADGNYKTKTNVPRQFKDTKFSDTDYEYGMYTRKDSESFFERVDIYVFHHNTDNHTMVSLINPKITEWKHDSLTSAETKVLQNSMTLVYENVLYHTNSGNSKIPGFVNEFYDPNQSPLKMGGNSNNDPNANEELAIRPGNAAIFNQPQLARQGSSVFDKTGNARQYNIPPQKASLFDKSGKPRQYGYINPPYRTNNQLLDIAAILAKDYLQKNGLGRVGPKGYNIASGALNYSVREPAGKFYEQPTNQYNPGVVNLPGGIGVNVFKGINTSVDGKLRVNPAAIIFPPKR